MCSAVKRRGFSLVEVLVVISTVSALMAISMPALISARSYARGVVCRSNLRQLVLANMGYSNENDGFYVPAASDLWKYDGGYNRWHGVRENANEPFDPRKGPLVDYLGDGKAKECPRMVNFVKGGNWAENFEQGCGGYGYNMTYIGSRLWCSGITTPAALKDAYARTTNVVEVCRPYETLMFADCAISRAAGQYIEYSFAEPPYFVISGKPYTKAYASPSIHFRHLGKANICWADGHIEPRPMAQMDVNNVWNVASASMDLGWFEPVDNTLFDLE
jgi:prepilin-type processing-associated H-X9-DG protein/prepilin-type N-terminal cleavage/methylation domain-containing protein